MNMDWQHWHLHYDVSSVLQARLQEVCEQIAAALDTLPAGPVRIISICSGDGRDLLQVLRDHARRKDVRAWLIDTHVPSLERGRENSRVDGLDGQLHFVPADATMSSTYTEFAPGDIVVCSGVLGHQSSAGELELARNLAMLCRPGGIVIWNRHMVTNGGGAQVVAIRQTLAAAGFRETTFTVTHPEGFGVGTARYEGSATGLTPGRRLFEFEGLPTLAPAEPAPDGERTLSTAFEAVVARHPNALALVDGKAQLTYAALNAAANRLAHRLLREKCRTGDRVAIWMRHGAAQIAAFVGVLKAGTVVVVLNANDPLARIRQIVAATACRVVVTDAVNRDGAWQLASLPCTVVQWEELERSAAAGNLYRSDPSDPAYILFTSGSTGTPNGVIQTHRNLLDNVVRQSRGLELDRDSRLILLAALSGGQGISTTWCGLLSGACTYPFPMMDVGLTGLAHLMKEQAITTWVSSAPVFRRIFAHMDEKMRWPALKVLRLASDQVDQADMTLARRHLSPECRISHTLSCSEGGNLAEFTARLGDSFPPGRLPAGRAAPGISLRIQDDRGMEVASGEIGELVVFGHHLSPGYWQNAILTAERFLPPRPEDHRRGFKTGDLARFRPDGNLEFCGRAGRRMKISGYRLEPLEIEEAITRHPGVMGALIRANPGTDGEQRIRAYVKLSPGSRPDPEDLRKAMRDQLPTYMHPHEYVFLEEFPLNDHGKIDERRLAGLSPSRPGPVAGLPVRPHHESTALLLSIWESVLKKSPVTIHDDFLDLGGTSLIATVIVAKIQELLEIQLSPTDLLEHPTIERIVAVLDRRAGRKSGWVWEDPGEVGSASLPLSYAQERIWMFSRSQNTSISYVKAARFSIEGPLNVDALSAALQYITQRHDILRTAVVEHHGEPIQTISPLEPFRLAFEDFSGRPDGEKEASRLLVEQARRPVELSRAPLLQLRLVRLRPDYHLLLQIHHHLISDDWSWLVFWNELALLYTQAVRREPWTLPPTAPIQYGRYAVWQRSILSEGRPEYQEALAFWLKTLANVPPALSLPFVRRRPDPAARPEDGVVEVPLVDELSAKLDACAPKLLATPYSLQLAALLAFLARQTGTRDLLIGLYVSNRNREALFSMIGPVFNLVPLRILWERGQTFSNWLKKVSLALREAQTWAEMPFELLVGELLRRRSPPPKVRLIFNKTDLFPRQQLSDAIVTRQETPVPCMPWGCTIGFVGNVRGNARALFDATIYEPKAVRDFIMDYLKYLDRVITDPDSKI